MGYLESVADYQKSQNPNWVRDRELASLIKFFDKPILDSGGVCLISLSAQRASKHDSSDGRHWLVEKIQALSAAPW